MTSDRVVLIPVMTMMNSYHYYYCYDYDDYPSCYCCSILLNGFLSLDERDLLHLETPLIFIVPQKDYSNEKKQQPSVCSLHPVSDLQTLLTSTTDTTDTTATVDSKSVAQ